MAVLAAAAVLAADVLPQALVLIGLGLVRDVGVGVGRGGLGRRARAGADVPSGGRDRCVAVDRVLVAVGSAGCPLGRAGDLRPQLEPAGAAATGQARAPADVLAEVLILVGLGPVRDVGGRVRRRCLGRRARARVDVPTRGRDRRVRVHRVLVAVRGSGGDLVGVGLLHTKLEATRAAAPGDALLPVATVATAPAVADVLVERLVLIGLRVVRDVGGRVRRRRLCRAARAGGDVPTGDRDGHVRVHGVLVAVRDPESALVGLSVLDTSLEAARSTAAGQARAPADVLAEVLVLVGLRPVRDVGGRVRRRRLRRAARAGRDVPTGDRDGHVRVHGVLVAHRGTSRELVGLGVLDPGLESARATAAERAGPAADVLVQRLVLIGLGVVRNVGGGRGARRLRRRARAGVHVAARDRNRDVGVDCVLVAVGDPGRQLVGVRVLDSGLESTRTTTAGVTTGVAADVLVQMLVLIGLGPVRDVGGGARRGRLS